MDYHGEGEQKGWEMELASDDLGQTVVWKSNFITDANQISVDSSSGQFLASLAEKKALELDMVPMEEVVEEAKAEGIEDDKTREIIERLLKEGDIYKPRHGFLKPTQKWKLQLANKLHKPLNFY